MVLYRNKQFLLTLSSTTDSQYIGKNTFPENLWNIL